MKINKLYDAKIVVNEDVTSDNATIICHAIDKFIKNCINDGISDGFFGKLMQNNTVLHWSVAFAGGDNITLHDLKDEDFKDFIDSEFPYKYMVFGHAFDDSISISIRFNPYNIDYMVNNLSGDKLMNKVEGTIDHEMGHIKLGKIPRSRKINTDNYHTMGDELNSNLTAMMQAYYRYIDNGKDPTFDDIINVLPDSAINTYNSSYWRKILLKGLHRRGIDISSLL